MPRLPRFVLPDVVHHVVARGVNKTRIFDDASDKDRYLKRFAIVAAEEKVLVHGYCLMDNHVHWLLTPTCERGLARLFQRVHTWWAMLYNQRHERTGHLFQSRYHSVPMDEQHYWEALRYVELNPCEAGLVARAEDWEHSSARAHLGKSHSQPPIQLTPVLTQRRYSPADWRIFLGQYDPTRGQALLAASAGCRPWGHRDWIAALEQKYCRRLRRFAQGRPKHSQQALNAA